MHCSTKSLLSAVAAMTIVACAGVGCIPRPYRVRYLSFEKVDGILIESTARLEINNLFPGERVPVQYRLKRKGYEICLTLERGNYRPFVVVKVESREELRVAVQPLVNMRSDRMAPCGAYEAVPDDPRRFAFGWEICGDNASPSEFVVSFDVVDGRGSTVGKELIPFELKSDGIAWYKDSL